MTTSAASGSDAASAFASLHPGIQRWIWDQGWAELRVAQSAAAPLILSGDVDVILSAATAAGKTEAAFMPILSSVGSRRASSGVEVLYLSPLKALINDQFDRLSEMAARVDIPVHRWHGDVGAGHKAEVLRDPTGLLLITPESLEALFVVRGPQVPRILSGLRYIVVDELHSFIGTERGAQLQSLLHRVELSLRRRVPRVALSATLGNMEGAAEFLRPGAGRSVLHIVTNDDGQAVKLQLRGYVARDPQLTPGADAQGDAVSGVAEDKEEIAHDLYATLRGSDNLAFANTRQQVEFYADSLRRRSEQNHVPNEFFAHHGNLSKDLRDFVEVRLKDKTMPISAICTSTLEMGIDIGAVKSIAQIGAPPTVAAMRQRLGRSGRRGNPAVLRIYVSEPEVTSRTALPDHLRPELVQSIAMVNLLLKRWYEPSDAGDMHLSTLVQQLLSLIAQHGGVMAPDAYSALCGSGTFRGLSSTQFAILLRHLGSIDVLMQSSDGTLLLGQAGERLVNHYSFYTAFQTPEEWRLFSDGRDLGTLPINFPLQSGSFLIFSGRRWRVVSVDPQHRVVDLRPSPGGRLPHFTGTSARVHDQVREEMLAVYQGGDVPRYLDIAATDLLIEARQNFARHRLSDRRLVPSGADTYVFLWAGDRVIDTVVAILKATDLTATRDGIALSIDGVSPVELAAHLVTLLAGPSPDAVDLAATVHNKEAEKYDGLLPEELLTVSYAARSLDIDGAWRALRRVAESAVAETPWTNWPGVPGEE